MMRLQKQTGFTLVELLVGLALGVLLLSIVITIFLGSKATFRAATGVARSQEATRFATHFLKQDIRMSGFSECSEGTSRRNLIDDTLAETFPASVENGVFGWEYNGTDVGDAFNLNYDELDDQFDQAELTAARESNSGNANDWTGRYIQGENPGAPVDLTLPATLSTLNPLRGSDIIMVSISEPLAIFPEGITNRVTRNLEVTDINGDGVPSDVAQGAILKVGDCSSIDTFQNSAGPGDTFVSRDSGSVEPGNKTNGLLRWQKSWGPEARLYETTTSVYYVGTGASGKPSLFRYSTVCGLGTACDAATEELVEGVESMQVLYGENDTPGTERDSVARQRARASDTYRSANSVVDFRNVVSVKVGLLLRSPEAGNDDTSFPTRELLDQITIDPPDDQFQRFVSSTTVRIHNRGL